MLFPTSCRSAHSRRGCSFLPAASPLISPAVGPLFCTSCLLDHPTRSLLTSREYSSVLLRLLDVLVCLSLTPCATLSRFSMSSLLANCSLVHSMLTHVLRVVCWTDQSLWTSLSCSGDQLSVDTSVLRVCSALASGVDSHRRRSPLLLFRCCGHRRAGRVPRGQWALLDTDMLVLIDRPACLVEPSLHLRSAHQVLAPHGPLTVSVVSSNVGSVRRAVLAPSSSCSGEPSWMISWDARSLVSSAGWVGLHTGVNS